MPAKLSPSLKALLKAPHARGRAIPAPAPALLNKLFDSISHSAGEKGLGTESWLTLSVRSLLRWRDQQGADEGTKTATLVTLNSPASLCALYDYATTGLASTDSRTIERAALMREAGLKCISFSGIPRAINSLGALRAHIPTDVAAALSTHPTRQPTPSNIHEIASRSLSLWQSIYEPHASKLLSKLAESHPDLPVHILSSHYGALLSDPPSTSGSAGGGVGKVGRVLTSVVAVSCLRAQGGVEPQVASHIFGLRNSGDAGSGAELEEVVEGGEWLTSNEGAEWVLERVDEIVRVVMGDAVSFAGGRESVQARL